MSAIVLEDGGILHYEAVGRGPPVIFLHSWVGSWRYWLETMEEVAAKGFRSYALDFWGFGDSRGSEEISSVFAYAAQLVGFVKALGITGQLSLVGHALGALVALEFAARHPDVVSMLVLVSLPIGSEAIRGRRILSIFDDSLLAKWRQRRWIPYREVLQGIKKADVRAVAASLESDMEDTVVSTVVSREGRPTLIVHGGKDGFVNPMTTDGLDSDHLIAGLRVIRLPGSGHFPMLDASAVFNRLLVDFLAGDDVSELELKEFWERRVR